MSSFQQKEGNESERSHILAFTEVMMPVCKARLRSPRATRKEDRMAAARSGSFSYSIGPRTWMCVQYTPGVASMCRDMQILKLVFLSVDTVAMSGSPCHGVWRNPGVWTRSEDGMRPRRCLLQGKGSGQVPPSAAPIFLCSLKGA